MKKKWILFYVFFGLSLFVFKSFAQKDIFFKQIEFKLEEISKNSYENEYFITLNLNKGTTYKFVVTNNNIKYPGKAIIQILDGNNLVGTNVTSSNYYEKFQFKCNKTGFYDLLIKFKEGELGDSVIDIYMVQ
ncbi:MAG TPA: hypothetical protein VE912_10885 [Bacteroidales bacterium]|nr:hypothetical protein [Bacteroidales bacterium]